ncbi:MAG: FG-GAP repeat protein [Planctomycetota bacterium]
MQAYVKASNTGNGDGFGRGVALSGDRLAVGAWFEGSSATGIDGDQSNDDAGASGAVYVFGRSGATWSQVTYLKASNTDAGDNLGKTVGISGTVVVAGAFQEDGSATGVDGQQNLNNMPAAGAAYAFDLDQPWEDLGQPLGGSLGLPLLTGDGTLESGTPVALHLSKAEWNSAAALVIGVSVLNAPFKGGTMVPMPDTILPGFPTSPTGTIELASTWPGGVPTGFTVTFQFWITDAAGPQGLAASNGLSGTTP